MIKDFSLFSTVKDSMNSDLIKLNQSFLTIKLANISKKYFRHMILLLSGKAGVGKDTFADYLVSHHHFTKLAFAKTMKDMSSQIYQIPRDFFDDREKKDTIIKSLNKTPRDILIEFSAKMRAKDPYFFIKQVAKFVEKGKNYAISDCRFFAEIEYFKKEFPDETISIWIERKVENVPDNLELTSKDCDFVIHNDKTPFDGNYLWNQLQKKLNFS